MAPKIVRRKLGLIAKLRKPIPPPTRVEGDESKYSRARERARAPHNQLGLYDVDRQAQRSSA